MINKLKNVLVLFGSPHKNGNTAKLLSCFLDFLPKSEIKIINAYEENFSPCIDCGVCSSVEKCFYDDMNEVDSLLRKADILIIASPVYNASFPAPLKTIFDRMQRYYQAKFSLKINTPIKKPKKSVVLLTQGSEKEYFENGIMSGLKPIMKIINAEEPQCLFVKNTDNENLSVDNLFTKIKNDVEITIENLYNTI